MNKNHYNKKTYKYKYKKKLTKNLFLIAFNNIYLTKLKYIQAIAKTALRGHFIYFTNLIHIA